MTEVFALLASSGFAISHILIRRGLTSSNAFTGSFISIVVSAVALWVVTLFFIPLSSFKSQAVWYFAASGIFAPGLGRIFNFMGIERVGVNRAVPISSSSPLFASTLAVLFVGESWPPQNIIGTSLVVLGLVALSRTGKGPGEWRKIDLIYPAMAALSFSIANNLRKLGLIVENLPLMASAVNTTSALLFATLLLRAQGGLSVLRFSRRSLPWFLGSGVTNTLAMLSTFHALSHGKVVVVDPLINASPLLTLALSAIFLRDLEVITPGIVFGVICVATGTILVVTL